jgi:glycosyltransferase involved in cell wall biosynthesis
MVKGDRIYFPDYFGVFLDALANEVEHLLVIAHEASHAQQAEINYKLQADNIELLSLGIKTSAWYRSIFHKKYLKLIAKGVNDCDLLIVRSPTPLGPYFNKIVSKGKLVFMIVGDYSHGAKHLYGKSIRDKIVRIYIRHNHWQFMRAIEQSNIIVNSHALYEQLKDRSKHIKLIKTTTLSVNDFMERPDTCQDKMINLLYTGRIDPAKGLFELLEALKLLVKEEYNVELHLVGWEDDPHKSVEQTLIKKADALGIGSRLVFHGRKSIGHELNKIYRMADIYVLPSYHEGFPRSIWEAMANSLPVVTTSVGGIPFFLKSEIDCLLIQPKNVIDLVESIKRIINENSLRRMIIKNGYEKAKQNTLEVQSRNTKEYLEYLIDSNP